MKSHPILAAAARGVCLGLLCHALPAGARETAPRGSLASVRTLQFLAGAGGGAAAGLTTGLTAAYVALALAGCGDTGNPDQDRLGCGIMAGFVAVAGGIVGMTAGSAVGTYLPGRLRGGNGSLAACFLGSAIGMGAAIFAARALEDTPALGAVTVLALPPAGALALYQATDAPTLAIGLAPGPARKPVTRPALRASLRLTLARF